ncbi:Ribokinase-like protein [Dichotomocladium elegans]|nr:Ribokinase-like protein [Dichotomocladium elegans]
MLLLCTGMRVWLDPPESRRIAYIAQEGHDLPPEIKRELDDLNITLQHNQHLDKPTTRGLNTFRPNDHRDFEYIHPIIRVDANDPPLEWIKSIRTVHIISMPERAIEIVQTWRARYPGAPARFVWEPVPWSALPEEYPKVREAAKYVDVVTPNHEEAAALLGGGGGGGGGLGLPDCDGASVETCCSRLFNDLYGDKGTKEGAALIVRAGKLGAVVCTSTHPNPRWVPAYWARDPARVVDVTGAGNAFCGGLCVGLEETGYDPYLGSYYGAVSASFAVEQVGLPRCNADTVKEARARLKDLLHHRR